MFWTFGGGLRCTPWMCWLVEMDFPPGTCGPQGDVVSNILKKMIEKEC